MYLYVWTKLIIKRYLLSESFVLKQSIFSKMLLFQINAQFHVLDHDLLVNSRPLFVSSSLKIGQFCLKYILIFKAHFDSIMKSIQSISFLSNLNEFFGTFQCRFRLLKIIRSHVLLWLPWNETRSLKNELWNSIEKAQRTSGLIISDKQRNANHMENLKCTTRRNRPHKRERQTTWRCFVWKIIDFWRIMRVLSAR